MKESGVLRKYMLIILSGVLWGTIGMFIKILYEKGSSSEYTTFLRMFFGFLLLFLITLIKEGAGAFVISRRMLLSCVLLGVVSMSLNNLCYTNAVDRLGMSLAAAMLYMAPVFTAVESKLLFHEKIGPKKTIALAVNVAGCVLAATGGRLSAISVSAAGLLFGLGAALAYSTQTIFGRMATDEGSPFVVATYNFFFAAAFTLIAARPWTTTDRLFDPEILLWGFLFGLIPTTIAYLLFYTGIQGLTESSKVPVLCSVELVAAAALGVAIFDEHLTAASIAGMAMILFSIILTSGIKKCDI